ncbi:hypothetical protein [Methyloversatilis sp.]|uniref:hypothetical protein n=1 Tax=Methyloversatilis sp. TaxID=2569862 RepID=UPI003D2CA6D3
MSNKAPLWRFRSSVDNARARRLLAHPNFDAIASLLEQAIVERFSWEAFSGQSLRGCHRASFLLRVPEAAYDAFFNSPSGYRGQFAASAIAGEEANRQLLSQLGASMLAYAESHSQVAKSLILRSLNAAQAKIWIFEAEVEAQLGITEFAIAYEPWERASENGVGLLAPVGTHLEVKGGWLAPSGDERHNSSKSGRSEEIHRTGFS